MGLRAAESFRRRFGREPSLVRAPGRVNLIGEHTDYNDGFVLPVAIDVYLELAFARNDEGVLRGYSLDFDREDVVSLSGLAPVERPSWLDYAAGVAWAAEAVEGMDFVVGGALPVGGGLSSSAAFELAVARALSAISGATWDPRRAAALAQRAESEYVGMPCGIMDQMAVALSKPGSALLLDCRSLVLEHVALPATWRIVVMDTGSRRALATSGYAERRRECEEAAALVGVRALRDASVEALERERARLGESLHRRALHVVEENERTLAMARALLAGDGERVGSLMAASHRSLRDLFEVSTPPLDRIVELATRHPGCVGARMTGAGFGGSAVALVEAAAARGFIREVEKSYRELGEEGKLYLCRAGGALTLEEKLDVER